MRDCSPPERAFTGLKTVVAGEEIPPEQRASLGLGEVAVLGTQLVDDAAAAGEFGVLLRVVADGRLTLEDDLAGERIELAHDVAQERRLAGAIRAGDAEAFAGVDGGGQIAEERLVAKGHRELFEVEQRPLPHVDPFEPELHGAAGLVRLSDELAGLEAAFQPLEAPLRLLAALGGVIAGEEVALFGDVRLVLLELPLLGQNPPVLGFCIIGIVAGVLREAPMLDLDDAFAEAVEQIAVVGNNDGAAVVAGEEPLEPADGVDVEVIRRLVQQQQRTVLEQELRERGAALLPAGQGGHRQAIVRLLKAQATEDLVKARLEAVPAGRFELGARLVVPIHELFEFAPRLGVSHLLGNLLELLFELEEVGEDAEDLVVERAVEGDGRLLRQVSNLHAAGGRDGAQVGFEIAGEQAKEGGLAGAVGADQAHGLAGVEVQRDVAQHDLRSELLGDALDAYGGHAFIIGQRRAVTRRLSGWGRRCPGVGLRTAVPPRCRHRRPRRRRGVPGAVRASDCPVE